jgi:hypothetical protein
MGIVCEWVGSTQRFAALKSRGGVSIRAFKRVTLVSPYLEALDIDGPIIPFTHLPTCTR